jgi:putative sterol carrier protein
MPSFLSRAWIEALAAAAAREDVAAAATTTLVVVQRVHDDVGATQEWHLAIAPGAVQVGEGAGEHVPGPRVVLEQDAGTAAAIARGELNAQQAFLAGRVQARGDVGALLGTSAVLRALDAATADLRAATTFDAVRGAARA